MAIFDTIPFSVDRESFQESRDGRVSIIEIPHGDTFYVQTAGRSPLKMSFTILLADAERWGALNALIGQEGTLSIETLNTHNAVLMSLSRPAPELDGQVKASASFVITDA